MLPRDLRELSVDAKNASMKNSARLGIALVVAGVAAAVACSRSDISSYTHGGVEDAGGGGDANGDAIVSGCVHALAPSRPTHGDDAGTDIEFYDAIRRIDFGDGGAPIGFDLDETCTCPGPDSCVASDAGTRCDLAGGVDNAFSNFVQSFSSATNIFNASDIDATLASGHSGLLVRVKGYNGQANDTQVALRDPFDVDASLCGTDALYQLIKGRICATTDISENVLDDNHGAPCDAFSFAFAFDGVPATYGSVLAFDSFAGCGPSWTDECP